LPTDVEGRVIRDPNGTVIPGFYSAGEAACVSVHGANRLGTNSLVDLVVFGRRAGRHMLSHIAQAEWPRLPREPEFAAESEIAALLGRERGERVADIRATMQDVMMDKVSVVRNEQGMREAQDVLAQLRHAYQNVAIQDHGKRYNTELTEALELGCMLDCAESIVFGALARQESRGAHYREDFQARDDVNWLAHSLVYKTSGGLDIDKKPVTLGRFEPKERKY
jgi:succinate dehydrogenase / fumarate reductase, flavoprotein subunit